MLETFSALRCCVLMLDVGCEDQVLEMFKIFFSVIRLEFLIPSSQFFLFFYF